MKKYWLNTPFFDSIFILSPPFIVLLLITIFQEKINYWQEEYPFWIWLFFIVFIDVAHVYATLFKTYFNPTERERLKKPLTLVPIVCLIIGILLFSLGIKIFWSVLAYVAVFHFIRQQYGFMKLYLKSEENTNRYIENLSIYNATLYPMLYWFLSPKKNFNWFTDNEFLKYENHFVLHIITAFYFVIIVGYALYIIKNYIQFSQFNLPKILLVTGTYLSWYMGIVYYNNDLIFTALNVVSHGVPYIGLVYINQKKENHLKFIPKLVYLKGLVFFLGVILLLAFLEEYLWEVFVWNENFESSSYSYFKNWHFLLVPLLMVPQFTHYVLDGIIWKRKTTHNPSTL